MGLLPGDDLEYSCQWSPWLHIFIVDDEDMEFFMEIRADLEDLYLRIMVISA